MLVNTDAMKVHNTSLGLIVLGYCAVCLVQLAMVQLGISGHCY
jgi:hypothetical protein